jgi:Protein kinase domain/Domain of Unknown Function (DUF1080)
VLRLGELLVFAMEYVPGDDLGKIVRDKGPLPPADACRFAMQAAHGLEHARSKGMVHRDIKPNNLIVSNEGGTPVVKILDFGLAKMTREANLATGLTGAGKMLGTPDFIAPEQIADAAAADIRADIYSLGCTLYALLVGQPPFAGKSLYEVIHAHVSTEPRSVENLRPDLPPGLAAVVARMMAKDPAKRYQTPAEVAAALAPFADARTPAAPTMTAAPVKPASARRPRSRIWMAIAALGLCGVLTAIVAWRSNFTREPVVDDGTVLYEPDTSAPIQKNHDHAPTRPIAPLPPRSDEAKFEPLFNGVDLSGWVVESGDASHWKVEDHELVARSPSWEARNYLLTKRDYADFVLRFDVKFGRSTGSAVAVRAVAGEKFNLRKMTVSDHPSIKLRCDGEEEDPLGGSRWLQDLVRNVPPLKNLPCAPKVWHAVELAVLGDTCTMTVDGTKIVDLHGNPLAVSNAARPGLARRTGRIGLQAHTGEVRFRNLRIREVEEFIPVADSSFFNASDMTGWTGLPGYWSVQDGAIVGAPANGVATHTCLVSDRSYRDFELRFKVRRKDGLGDSGLLFRAEILSPKRFTMRGPQMEIDSADNATPPGAVFNEPSGTPRSLPDREAIAAVWKEDEFNAMSIRCVGQHVTTVINGVVAVDRELDWLPAEGRIGWKLHGTRSPREVVFKDIEFVDLTAAAARKPGTPIRP